MKKKILICSHTLNIGGAERSLIDLLNCIDYEKYDVDLFLYRHIGEWMSEIPNQVNLLDEVEEYSCLYKSFSEIHTFGGYKVFLGRAVGKYLSIAYSKRKKFPQSFVGIEYSHKYTKPFMPKICPETEYDMAISFLIPHYFVTDKVRAKVKVAWIHTDYSNENFNVNIKSELKMWNKYDKIAAVSDECAVGFLSKFPQLEDKIIKVENCLSVEAVSRKSEEYIPQEFAKDSINILSVGRYSMEKNFDNVPEICSIIRDNGFNVKWFLLGYGSCEQIIRDKIKKFGMEDYVILLGKRDNPYPYIKNCDLYIQPSRYEGKCVSVREAQMLNKPVIITAYATSKSQLKDGYDGVIVPMDNKDCADGICSVLSDEALIKRIIENTKNVDYSNKSELEKLYALMN